VTEIGFYSDPDDVGYQVDEVSLSSEQRNIDTVSCDCCVAAVVCYS